MVPPGAWLLYLVLAAGLVGRNPLVTAAAAVLIAIATLRAQGLLPLLERYSISVGLTLLIIGLLVPIAAGRMAMGDLLVAVRDPAGLLSVAGGALSAYMCGLGLRLLEARPEVMIGLILGTIVGVVLLGGIPVGPLAAAGFTAVLLELWRQVAGG